MNVAGTSDERKSVQDLVTKFDQYAKKKQSVLLTLNTKFAERAAKQKATK